jgi:hypothetical protein
MTFDKPFHTMLDNDVAGPYYIGIEGVVGVVDDFECVDSEEFVVAVDEHDDVIGAAVLCDGGVYVGQCGSPSFFAYDGDVLGDLIVLDPFEDEFVCVVDGGIVDDDHFIVFIVEVDDRLQIVFVPKVHSIVYGRHHDAKGQLRQTEIVLLRKPIVVLLLQLLLLLLNKSIRMRQTNVVYR